VPAKDALAVTNNSRLSVNQIPSPRLAATIILAREAPHGFELYMTRRSRQSAFADAFVFPGGTVDARDFTAQSSDRTLGLEHERIRAVLRATTPPELPNAEPRIDAAAGSALLIAALRELFEEAGILIACTRGGLPVDAALVRSENVQRARNSIGSGELSFAEFLIRNDWFADARELVLFSHWITPRGEPRRYNTHFFFALAPPGQAGLADARETHEGLWIAPQDALARYRERDFHLVYPTIKHLERLRAFESIAQLHAFARSKPVLTILPTTADGDEGFAMPHELENTW
jgi:8-oxo-dGTP pyrophosphatase MutT (NUDIX family)